jgi:hypothetical protein
MAAVYVKLCQLRYKYVTSVPVLMKKRGTELTLGRKKKGLKDEDVV